MKRDKIPDRRALEKKSANLSKMLESKNFKSKEEFDNFMNSIIKKGNISDDAAKTTDELAQDIVYDAWDTESRKERIKMAKKALSISPNCADAYNLLAEEEAKTVEEAKELYQKAISAAEKTIQKKTLKDLKGHFWGHVRTRPYMRAKAGLMECLWEIGEHDEAIKHAKEMLKLNTSDNQGIRYILLSYLIELSRYSELDILLNNKNHKNDCGIDWLYTRALFTFTKEGDSENARKELKIALSGNKFVPEYITGAKVIPSALPGRVISGGEDEASCYAARSLRSWESISGAVEWLRDQSGVKIYPKVGRNAPCPCGSGKKYKKCCGMNEKMDLSIPADMKPGTTLDDYMMLVQGIALYSKQIMKLDKDGKELKQAAVDFERRFKPGQDDGVPSSLFMSWLYFDFRFGSTGETVCERFIKSPYMDGLNEPGPTHAQHFANSYCSFYEIKSTLSDKMVFKELGTGDEWKVNRISDPFERNARVGDIWYLRLIGVASDAYIYTQPYIFPPRARSNFIKAMRKQKEGFIKHNHNKRLPERDVFRESCKADTLFWAEYMLLCSGNPVE